MPFTSTKDTEFGDCYFDISNTDKRLIRATLKTYERTKTYVFLKLFKKTAEEYEFEQRISLTLQEFGNLVNTAEKILESEEKSTKDCSKNRKRPPNKNPNFNTRARMVEAMYERSASYFKHFQKQFRFKIVDQKPTDITSSINHAVCPHFESECCQIATNHFQLLIDSSIDIGSTKQNKSFAVPCLFITFKHLFSNSSKLETNRDVFTKLKSAVDFNVKTGEKPSNGSQASTNFKHNKDVDDSKNVSDEIYRSRTENNPQCHLNSKRA